jgi:hypothetical protein
MGQEVACKCGLVGRAEVAAAHDAQMVLRVTWSDLCCPPGVSRILDSTEKVVDRVAPKVSREQLLVVRCAAQPFVPR